MSREHYTSKSVLELIYEPNGVKSTVVPVRNLAFQKRDIVQNLGISSLTGWILCKNHNESLSPFDVSGRDMIANMDNFNQLVMNPMLATEAMHLDGDRFELWMLKTLCGFLYSGAADHHFEKSKKGEYPSTRWLEILFNGAKFPEGQGLYYIPKTKFDTDPEILKLSPLKAPETDVVMGLRAWFFNFEFVLLVEQLAPGVPSIFYEASYRPESLREFASNAQIQFDWLDGPRSDEILVYLMSSRPYKATPPN